MKFSGKQFVFEAKERIGAGGMGEVLRGVGTDGLQEEVAIKTPLAHLPAEAKELFLREAEAASRAAGPGVVRLIDWGEDPPFLAFELVRDPTLDREMVRRRAEDDRWSISELCRYYA